MVDLVRRSVVTGLAAGVASLAFSPVARGARLGDAAQEFLNGYADIQRRITPSEEKHFQNLKAKNLGQAAFLFHAGQNAPLDSENPDLVLHAASTTKLATGVIYFEAKKAGLIPQDKIEYWDTAFRKIIIASSNFNADDFGEHFTKFPGVREQVEKMRYVPGTLKAFQHCFLQPLLVKIEAMDSRFGNASGLPGHETKNTPDNVTTARDLMKLCNYVYANVPEVLALAAETHVDGPRSRDATLANTNPLLPGTIREEVSPYEGVDGLKTGKTNLAGYHLIASAQREGTPKIISIRLGSADRQAQIKDSRWLLDKGFSMHPPAPEPERGTRVMLAYGPA